MEQCVSEGKKGLKKVCRRKGAEKRKKKSSKTCFCNKPFFKVNFQRIKVLAYSKRDTMSSIETSISA